MNIKEKLKSNLKLATNMNENVFKKLLENTFSTLTRNEEVHNISTLYNSKPDIIKAVYAALLTITAEFGRNNLNRDSVKTFLLNDCSLSSDKATLFTDLYEKHKEKLQIKLGNIGSNLPHMVDAQWKIDYIIKTDNLDQADGPFFRITLVTNTGDGTSKSENINFTCNSQEMQDLVYKMKDAVRHCQRVAME